MASTSLPTSVIELVDRSHHPGSIKESKFASKLSEFRGAITSNRLGSSFVQQVDASEDDESIENPELRLPSRRSLFVIIGGNALFQVSFFIVVSSASLYTEFLGGSATFSGLIIGIPPLTSGVLLLFATRYDRGQYGSPLQFAYACTVLGNIIYALAYRANWLYLILIGRMVTGGGFIAFMYSKRYCSDPRIVGIRRRTTLASWLVVGQALGFSAGPFLGGLLYKIGFSNDVFNGVTSPGWIMATVWLMFWGLSTLIFQDVNPRTQERSIELEPTPTIETNSQPQSPTQQDVAEVPHQVSFEQWGVIICMCYYAMTCFFILGSWEANIPVFTAEALGYSPFRAGNFIALGGISSFPFLLLNVRYARRIQDRVTLAIGTSLGFIGLLVMLVLLHTDNIKFGSLLVCWFLVALGFNLASTCTLSLLSKQLPDTWNGKVSMAIQYSNYTGRVTGAILGGAGVKIGMMNYIGVQLAVVGIGGVMYLTLWKQLKAKTG